jgi:iron complex transport system ATP-binding protein
VAVEFVLWAKQVSGGYEARPVLRGVELAVGAGDFLGVIGPNGAGKSTLLRVMAGVLAPSAGEMLLLGRPLGQYRRREVARILAVVPAPSSPLFSFSVREFVTMGRTPYLGRLQSDRPEDRRLVDESLAAADATGLAERPITELSGGEWQRVNIARALAQQPRVLLLDEPTAFLDLGHQREIFELLSRLNREQGLTVVCVSHDLNLAAEYCPRLAVLAEGAIYADGAPAQVITEETIAAVYHAPVRVDRGPSGQPRVSLLSEAALALGDGPDTSPTGAGSYSAPPGETGDRP